jgi:hypothetical protein
MSSLLTRGSYLSRTTHKQPVTGNYLSLSDHTQAASYWQQLSLGPPPDVLDASSNADCVSRFLPTFVPYLMTLNNDNVQRGMSNV